MPHTPSQLKIAIQEKLKQVMDPELGVSIWDLGLVYGIAISQEGIALITMTLTTIGCPLFPVIQKDIEDRLMEIDGVEEAKIDLVFDPPWTPEKMNEDAKIRLGWD
ncbi:MAG: metal-sulfur cluster assembly factor [Candidatus Moranbacteria bacterium]|nr:metal-sulfur cluster assembly factor [Candidatus Moranbacteria bacterium]MBP6034053.1 metal-sulfur cluster assembly factor [Candidatus Moranbacteria bacterium]MBP7696116.1 metal-sulfur cluster assembly factor [Candidatus Moranbacteria bacterium]